MKKPSPEIFEKICDQKAGNVSQIAKALNCSRRIIEKWLKSDQRFKEIHNDTKESFLDFTENQLKNLIKGVPELDAEGRFVRWIERPSESSIFFYLKTIGKDRGFVERKEVDNLTGDSFLEIMQRAKRREAITGKDTAGKGLE